MLIGRGWDFMVGEVMFWGRQLVGLREVVMSEARRRKCRVDTRAGRGGGGVRVVEREARR